MDRIAALDGIRGVAILLVLADHAGRAISVGIPLGQHGVSLFFVLSGFLITGKLMREHERTGGIDLRDFYCRRALRLLPCAWAYLLVIAIVARPSAAEIISAVLCFRNYLRPIQGFAGHFWSLSIEEQFYFCWPLIMLLSGPRRARWVAVFGAVGIALLRLWHSAELQSMPPAAFATQFRADALFAGCAAALFAGSIRRWLSGLVLPLCVGLVVCFGFFREIPPLTESMIAAAIVAICADCERSAISSVLELRPLRYIGVISYSIYVWQQLFLSLPHNAGGLGIVLVALAVVSILSHEYLEKPFMRASLSGQSAKA